MRVRIAAEIRRVIGQIWVWAFGMALIAVAAWSARWSPDLVGTTNPIDFVSGHGVDPDLRVSLAGSIELGFVQVATGLGVMLMALFVAAGPGGDFVDASAEIRRANGRAVSRYGARVLSVALLGLFATVLIAAGLVGIRALASVHNGNSLKLEVGEFDVALLIASGLLVVFHASWIVTLAQLQRTQATQLALPIGIVLAFFLVSRLFSVPVTPDGWIGPLLELHSERSMIDFWWSVGGRVIWPWGNVVLLFAIWVIAFLVGTVSDRAVTHPGRRYRP